jgi:hypothetical protein
VKTPWKLLHDAWMAVLGINLPDPSGKLGGLLFLLVVVGPLAILLLAARAFLDFVLPNSGLSTFLNEHFLGALALITGLFFFYSFFRSVWDGLREPTVKAPDKGFK